MDAARMSCGSSLHALQDMRTAVKNMLISYCFRNQTVCKLNRILLQESAKKLSCRARGHTAVHKRREGYRILVSYEKGRTKAFGKGVAVSLVSFPLPCFYYTGQMC